MTAPTLQIGLSDLETFDPRARSTGTERRFCCPFCGDGKPKDVAHRSMGVNTTSGAFVCHRCHASGLLSEFWTRTPKGSPSAATRQTRNQAQLRAAFPLSYRNPEEESATALTFDSEPLAGTPGAAYLNGRGIPLEVALLSGARFSPDWFGHPAIVFPLHDLDGLCVAAQGRFVDGHDKPKVQTKGPKKNAVFVAPTLDTFAPFDAKGRGVPFIVTEAPLDALSLAVAGFPAVALCGTTGPGWLRVKAALRWAFLGFDADEAGEVASADLAPSLESFGATVHRLRPGDGAKDWNEMLCQIGRDGLADFVAHIVLPHV